MKAFLYHVQINVRDAATSIPFYRALFAYLDYKVLVETRDLLGVSNGTTDFWLIETPRERRAMLWTIFVVLLVLWALGLVST